MRTVQYKRFPLGKLWTNGYLFWDEDGEAFFIDPGGDASEVLKFVKAHNLKLRKVLLTHGHLDHAGGVVALREHRPVPVIGPHADDDFLLQALPETTAQYGFPVSPAFEPTRWLTEGETLKVGSHAFQVLHIPGHTPGHVVFYCAEAGLLIAGDVLFYETIGRTDFPRGNHADLIHNIRTKLFVLPEDTRVIAGHGRMTDIGHEKRHNPFF